MIEWKEYDPKKPPVGMKWYFIVVGKENPYPWCAFYGTYLGMDGFYWKTDVFSTEYFNDVTHYAEINLPKIKPIAIEEDPNQAKLEL